VKARKNDHAYQNACRSRGWYRARYERFRPEYNGGLRRSPYVAIENEPPPKLIVDPTPLAAALAHGIVWTQYCAENVHIVPVFGAGALNVSPRIGHLHISRRRPALGWVEASDNTISVAGLPPGQHKMLVELVEPRIRWVRDSY
jgi:hypothetical protein